MRRTPQGTATFRGFGDPEPAPAQRVHVVSYSQPAARTADSGARTCRGILASRLASSIITTLAPFPSGSAGLLSSRPMAFARMHSIRSRAAKVTVLMIRAVGGRYRVAENTDTMQCVVALAFGYRLTGTGVREPGPCNEYLAALALATSNGRPIISQAEIDQAICSLRPSMGADHVIGSSRNPERYLDTHECAVHLQSMMGDNGWKTAVLIAHPHHLPRAQTVFASRGIETASPPCVRAIWDRKSSQPWTRGPLRWAIRELFAIWLYERRGWLRPPYLK